MIGLMIGIILSLGAVNGLIPIIIILVLVVAAAGLNRGYSLFNLFGLGTLASINPAGKASLVSKTPFVVPLIDKSAGNRLRLGSRARRRVGSRIKKTLGKFAFTTKFRDFRKRTAMKTVARWQANKGLNQSAPYRMGRATVAGLGRATRWTARTGRRAAAAAVSTRSGAATARVGRRVAVRTRRIGIGTWRGARAVAKAAGVAALVINPIAGMAYLSLKTGAAANARNLRKRANYNAPEAIYGGNASEHQSSIWKNIVAPNMRKNTTELTGTAGLVATPVGFIGAKAVAGTNRKRKEALDAITNPAVEAQHAEVRNTVTYYGNMAVSQGHPLTRTQRKAMYRSIDTHLKRAEDRADRQTHPHLLPIAAPLMVLSGIRGTYRLVRTGINAYGGAAGSTVRSKLAASATAVGSRIRSNLVTGTRNIAMPLPNAPPASAPQAVKDAYADAVMAQTRRLTRTPVSVRIIAGLVTAVAQNNTAEGNFHMDARRARSPSTTPADLATLANDNRFGPNPVPDWQKVVRETALRNPNQPLPELDSHTQTATVQYIPRLASAQAEFRAIPAITIMPMSPPDKQAYDRAVEVFTTHKREVIETNDTLRALAENPSESPQNLQAIYDSIVAGEQTARSAGDDFFQQSAVPKGGTKARAARNAVAGVSHDTEDYTYAPDIKTALILNPNTPQMVINDLRDDPDRRISKLARRHSPP